jgi:hypothetical protein
VQLHGYHCSSKLTYRSNQIKHLHSATPRRRCQATSSVMDSRWWLLRRIRGRDKVFTARFNSSLYIYEHPDRFRQRQVSVIQLLRRVSLNHVLSLSRSISLLIMCSPLTSTVIDWERWDFLPSQRLQDPLLVHLTILTRRHAILI